MVDFGGGDSKLRQKMAKKSFPKISRHLDLFLFEAVYQISGFEMSILTRVSL